MAQVEAVQQLVKYVGAKDSIIVQFPVPFLSKSEAQGDPVSFKRNKPTPLSPEQAAQLCKVSGESFKMCDEQGKGLRA